MSKQPTADAVFRALGGIRARDGYLCRCPVPSHGQGKGDRHPSLSIRDGDTRLLVHCFAGCSPAEVFAALAARDLTQEASEPVKTVRAPKTPPTTTAEALALWRALLPAPGTHAAAYLATRNLPADLPTIRYLPNYKLRSRNYHALIAALQAPDRHIVSVQLTLLDPTRPEKASVLEPRRIIGPSRGFALRLAPAAETLGLAEGYETGHAAMLRFGVPVWCSLGNTRLPFVQIPDSVRRLIVFADPDAPGRSGALRTQEAHPDRDVIVRYPPVSGPSDDRVCLSME